MQPVDQMMTDCNLQLRLQPASAASEDMFSGDSGDVHRHLQQQDQQIDGLNSVKTGDNHNDNHRQPQQQLQLTIFYNGRICACDVKELQAKAIILAASREMEERMILKKAYTPTESRSPISARLQSQLHGSTTGLSMKKSLQRFLQKRKLRIQNTSPYN